MLSVLFCFEDRVHGAEECILLLSPKIVFSGNFSMAVLTYVSNGVVGFCAYLCIYGMLFKLGEVYASICTDNLKFCICIFPCIGVLHDFKDFCIICIT